jgi:predicted NUDIX family phosphoesterase
MSANTSLEVEQVLVVPTELFRQTGYFNGINADVQPYLKTLLDPASVSYRPRDAMEKDPGFKQLIPYCILRCDGRIFHYTRGTAQGETRLHSKRSVGVGGHISTLDQHPVNSPYIEGLRRELEEEVSIGCGYRDACIGLLNDDSTEVGRVHLGIVHVIELDEPKVQPREKSMLNTGFAAPEELFQSFQEFETWSQLCLSHLCGR